MDVPMFEGIREDENEDAANCLQRRYSAMQLVSASIPAGIVGGVDKHAVAFIQHQAKLHGHVHIASLGRQVFQAAWRIALDCEDAAVSQCASPASVTFASSACVDCILQRFATIVSWVRYACSDIAIRCQRLATGRC